MEDGEEGGRKGELELELVSFRSLLFHCSQKNSTHFRVSPTSARLSESLITSQETREGGELRE